MGLFVTLSSVLYTIAKCDSQMETPMSSKLADIFDSFSEHRIGSPSRTKSAYLRALRVLLLIPFSHMEMDLFSPVHPQQ
jgi:hypothetical protein